MPELDALIDAWFAEELEESPVRATALGVDGHDDRLGDYSADAIAKREQRDAHWQATFEDMGDVGLSFDQQIDRDLLLSALRGRAVMRDWEAWPRDPGTYLNPCLSGVFTIFLHR